MDFTPTSTLIDATELAAQIFAARCSADRLREVDRIPGRFDAELWAALGEAGLLGLAVPEEYDGAGLGMVELAGVVEQAGRHVAAVPLAQHLTAAIAIAEHGDDEVKRAWLPKAASGEVLFTVADGAPVVQGPRADAVVDLREGVVLVTDAQWTPTVLTAGEQAGLLEGGSRTELAVDSTRVRECLVTLQAALQLGVVEGALTLTAGYARTREQFGRPIGTFQAVAQRLADGYIDVLGLRLTVQQAAWRLSEGLPAATEVASAAFWAAEAGHKLAHTAVHIHGGVGIDLDGETHRFFTAAKQGEFLLGGATSAARAIGAELAAG